MNFKHNEQNNHQSCSHAFQIFYLYLFMLTKWIANCKPLLHSGLLLVDVCYPWCWMIATFHVLLICISKNFTFKPFFKIIKQTYYLSIWYLWMIHSFIYLQSGQGHGAPRSYSWYTGLNAGKFTSYGTQIHT